MVFVRRMHTYKLIIFRRSSLILDAYNFSPQLFTNFSYHCILVHQFTARASGIGYSSYWKKDQFLLGPLSYPKAAVSSLETLFIWKCSGVINWFSFFFVFGTRIFQWNLVDSNFTLKATRYISISSAYTHFTSWKRLWTENQFEEGLLRTFDSLEKLLIKKFGGVLRVLFLFFQRDKIRMYYYELRSRR